MLIDAKISREILVLLGYFSKNSRLPLQFFSVFSH
ncbi:hypothetical protein pYV0066 (plasmid) [Yersinia pseudotuberculosis IP 32953]|uniref:Uncharacterized protein n=1 Tax=Yersinia pseudotuberculosis serotype I (strain IP32953) TaxID=273123 RepID=Q663K0_YERPS|nr:hypothetical protein pYV0066 [Yersinia pseudotuberculosis IP 32953]